MPSSGVQQCHRRHCIRPLLGMTASVHVLRQKLRVGVTAWAVDAIQGCTDDQDLPAQVSMATVHDPSHLFKATAFRSAAWPQPGGWGEGIAAVSGGTRTALQLYSARHCFVARGCNAETVSHHLRYLTVWADSSVQPITIIGIKCTFLRANP